MSIGPCRRLIIFPGSVWRVQVRLGPGRPGIKVPSREQDVRKQGRDAVAHSVGEEEFKRDRIRS